MAAFGVFVALFVVLGYLVLTRTRLEPKQLSDLYWEMTDAYLYDPSKLPDLAQWRAAHPLELKTKEDAVQEMNELLKTLNDPYTMVQQIVFRDTVNWESGEYTRLGFMLQAAYENVTAEACQQSSAKTGVSCKHPTITGVIINSPAAEAGLKAGDILTSIEGRSTASKTLAEVIKELQGRSGQAVALVVERAGVAKTVILVRRNVHRPTAFAKMIDADVGYLRITHFDGDVYMTALRQAEKLKKAKAIVVDLRDNPGGMVYTSVRMAGLFIKEGLITKTESRVPGRKEAPLYEIKNLRMTKEGLIEETVGKPNKARYPDLMSRPDTILAGKKVVVLVNENSASAAELFAGALKYSGGATIVGVKTFGKGVSQVLVSMPGWTILRVTNGKYFLPNGYWPGDGAQDKRGIDPDVVALAQSTLFDMGAADDQQLQQAVAVAKKLLV